MRGYKTPTYERLAAFFVQLSSRSFAPCIRLLHEMQMSVCGICRKHELRNECEKRMGAGERRDAPPFPDPARVIFAFSF